MTTPTSRRRTLLRGAAAPLLAASPLLSCAAVAQPSDLRGRLGGLRYGANLDRWLPVAKDNHPRRLGSEW